MNWEFIVEYLPLYEKATVLTVRIGLLGIAFAILVGFACAMVQYHRIPVVRQIVAVYIELSRNTPLLVQLFSFIAAGICFRQLTRKEAASCRIWGLMFY